MAVLLCGRALLEVLAQLAGHVGGTTARNSVVSAVRSGALRMRPEDRLCLVAQESHTKGVASFCDRAVDYYFGDVDIIEARNSRFNSDFKGKLQVDGHNHRITGTVTALINGNFPVSVDVIADNKELTFQGREAGEITEIKPLVDHPRVMRVVALSGGYSRDEANARLARNGGVIDSFSRDQENDQPLLVFYALIGNDVCNGHPGALHTSNRFLATSSLLTPLPACFVGLGRHRAHDDPV